MAIKNVIFCSQHSACERPAWRNWAVISITDLATFDAPLKSGWLDVLRLKFDDIDDAAEEENGYVRMGDLQARAVIEFVLRMQEDKRCEGILVHCWAGISRSAAVAKWISERCEVYFPSQYQLYNKHVYALLREGYVIGGYFERRIG